MCVFSKNEMILFILVIEWFGNEFIGKRKHKARQPGIM